MGGGSFFIGSKSGSFFNVSSKKNPDEPTICVRMSLVCQDEEVGGAVCESGILEGETAGSPFRDVSFNSPNPTVAGDVLTSCSSICDLPIRTRAFFSVTSSSGIPIGWAACNVFDSQNRLINGNRTLRLLPDMYTSVRWGTSCCKSVLNVVAYFC